MEKFSIPIISAIIERTKNNETEILVQTRWKPKEDPKYSGCLEISAGKIREFENVYDALNREVFEETGLRILKTFPDVKTKIHSLDNDGSFAFQPFCCQQQIKGGQPWIGFVFICQVEDKEPHKRGDGTKDIRWIKKSELKQIFEKTPEKIFTLQLGVLDYYFNKERHQK
jgi:8-oxo-dGTP pyrophosphatase MutT (NUDIX family)